MFRSAIVCFVALATVNGLVSAGPVTPMCNEGDDSFTCMKYKVIHYLENIMNKDNFQLSRNVEVRSNGFAPLNEQRGDKDVFEKVEDYVQSHDVTFNFPSADTKVTLSPKKLDDGEFSLNVKYTAAEARGKKSKLKKVMIPILVFVLLKAMTLVPLALGVLGLKAWNALQLSFFSFIISFALAVFQLCKKISAHGPWDHAGRSFVDAFYDESSPEAQELAYNAYN